MSPAEGVMSPLPSNLSTAILLVVSETEEIAKRVESHLRNAGHPLRTVWVTDLEDVEDVLRRSPPDMVLCADNVPKASPQDVIALCTRIAPDLPVVLMGTNRLAPVETIAALAAGARDLVAYADLRQLHHLELVCIRELVNHHHLRELRTVRARLADFEARHKNLIAGTTDAVAHIQEGILTHVNAAFATLLGYESPEPLEGSPLMDLVPASHQIPVKQNLKQLAQGKLKAEDLVEFFFQKKDGKTLAAKARLTFGQTNEDRFIELLIRTEAAPAPRPQQPQPSGQPQPAPQTAAPANDRLGLFEQLNKLQAAPPKNPVGLLLAVVDEFPAVEERLGFRDIEGVMAQLAALLKQRLRPPDQLFRFSNAELALLIQRPSASEIETLAETLRKDVAAQIFNTSTHEAHLSISVVAYPLSATDTRASIVSDVVREARKLSQEGGNKIIVLGPMAQSTQLEREEKQRAAQVKKAIEENRLKLAYQSIASLEGDTRQHFDVYVRMLDEAGKEIHARDFIPAAEKYGLIQAIDRWVVWRALKVLTKREGAQGTSALFVRLSEATLKDGESFLPWLKEQLKQQPLREEELVFGIQESILQTHIRKAKALTLALKGLGAGIAVDHFGTGASSAQLLEHIPASFVRFHHSFTKSFNDAKLQKKMAELMEVAKHKQVKTIVAHVEDANAMARLWQMGVNYIQGHHIQEPEVVLLSTDLPR